MQNNIPTVHISEIYCCTVKSTNLATVFAVLYQKLNIIKIFKKLNYRVAMETFDLEHELVFSVVELLQMYVN
jgi:hypothetical protein